MKFSVYDINGEVIKNDDTYIIQDNKTLKNLVLSSTELKPGKSTRGHKHEGQEEVYYFVSGVGVIELDDKCYPVQGGDVVLIEDGVFHRVHNKSNSHTLYFVCVFDGKRNH
mgnify:CR=1 FL=1